MLLPNCLSYQKENHKQNIIKLNEIAITLQNTGGQIFDNARAITAIVKICVNAKNPKTRPHHTGMSSCVLKNREFLRKVSWGPR